MYLIYAEVFPRYWYVNLTFTILTPSGFMRMSFPAEASRARRMAVAVPVCLDATKWTAV